MTSHDGRYAIENKRLERHGGVAHCLGREVAPLRAKRIWGPLPLGWPARPRKGSESRNRIPLLCKSVTVSGGEG